MMRPHMQRREFITLLGSAAAAWPQAARAQGDRVRRIGVLMTLAEGDPEGQRRLAALHEGLQKLGWTVGRNLRIDYRFAAEFDQLRSFAAELTALAPEVVIVHSTSTVLALRQESRSLPIVFVQILDPVQAGLVRSLAHPGGNTTGFALFEPPLLANGSKCSRRWPPGLLGRSSWTISTIPHWPHTCAFSKQRRHRAECN
jgi:putative ABC transport system substrate-binding protein